MEQNQTAPLEQDELDLSSQATTKPEEENWAAKHKELNDQYLRLAADFENVKRRYHQEQEQLRKYGAEKTVKELIPVIDNLERAASSLSENSDPKTLYQSFRLLQNQLLEAFKAIGIEKIDPVGKPFDPMYHEAISQVESAEHPDQTVINEHQTGFVLHDRVIRPSMVTVSTRTETENPFQQHDAQFVPEKDA